MKSIFLLLLLGLGQVHEAFAVSSGVTTTVVLRQAVTGSAAPLHSTVTGKKGVVSFGAVGLTLDNNGHDLSPFEAASVGTLQPRTWSSALTRADLLTTAATYFNNVGPAFTAALKNYLVTNGIDQAIYSYEQEVSFAGSGTPKLLIWTAVVQAASPKGRFSDPQIVDLDPLYVQATYTPLRPAAGLPAGWSYANPGQLTWRLVDRQLVPRIDWANIDLQGVYDEPDAAAAGVDPDFGVKCLANHAADPSCPNALDLKTLINQQGAIGAILDYGRRIKPVYDPVTDASGQTTLQARLGLAVQLREVSYTGCGSTVNYRNQGTYGYELSYTTDRYLVDVAGNLTPINRFLKTALSPTEPYDATKSGIPFSLASTLAGYLVDFSNPGRTLVPTSAVTNLVAIASISYVGSASQQGIVASGTGPVAGSHLIGATPRNVTVSCDQTSATLTITFPVMGHGDCGACIYSYRTYSFPANTPYSVQVDYLDSGGGGLWNRPVVQYDGDRTILITGNDGIIWHATFSTEHQCSPDDSGNTTCTDVQVMTPAPMILTW